MPAYENPDAASLAAAYAFGVARNHGFLDGNKRTAWVLARLFLADNGFVLSFDAIDAVRTVEALAAGSLDEVQLAAWFRARTHAEGLRSMTRQLLLLRHAKSSWDDPSLADHDRPLSKRGRKAAASMRAAIVSRALVPDLALVSTARRTRETFAALEPWPESFDRRISGSAL